MNVRNAGLLVILVLLSNSGCAVVVSSRVTLTGAYISEELIRQVEDHETTRQWLLENLGEPTLIDDKGDGMEDFTYECTERVKEHASVLFLFSFNSSVDRMAQCVFELNNGIVQMHYRRTARRSLDAEQE